MAHINRYCTTYRVEAISKKDPSKVAPLVEPHHALALTACCRIPRRTLQKSVLSGVVWLVAECYYYSLFDESHSQRD